jgi:hypothetical protein
MEKNKMSLEKELLEIRINKLRTKDPMMNMRLIKKLERKLRKLK